VVMTARPGKIRSVYDIKLTRPRDLHHLHDDPEFRTALSDLWDELADEVSAANAMGRN